MRNQVASNSALEDAAEYKHVVVIGNGPSGITLSYILAGNWPYYNGEEHPDEMLTARLRSVPADRSLLEQDLAYLSQGLEGRSTNPVSLLMDALSLPSADVGLDLPSLVSWKRCGRAPVDHVVLGKGPPGGVWQRMDGNVLTLSLAAWMALPGLPLREGPARGHRSQVAAVAHYYRDYVEQQGLRRYFRDGVAVTEVAPLPGQRLWRVTARDEASPSSAPAAVYVTPNVVLATGANDRPNKLGALGEGLHRDWVFHDLASLEKTLDQLAGCQRDCDPVLIVGAGLSAADAIIAARFRSLPIVHVFRRRSPSLEKQLPENMYPEYHKVQQMMGDGGGGYPQYRALARHTVVAFSSEPGRGGRTVTVQSPEGKVLQLAVSAAAVLIGSRPDLSFLQLAGGLGADPAQPVDCRRNPVAVNPATHEALNAPPGLYALGPLAGDNFVRFIAGGAVAIAAHLHQQQQHP